MFGRRKEDQLDSLSIKLLENFRSLQYTDIIGFGNILSVKEEDDFDDYLTSIIVAYMKQPKSKRKALLKLSKQLVQANKEMKADPNFYKVPPEELAKQIVETAQQAQDKSVEDSCFLSTIRKKYPPGV